MSLSWRSKLIHPGARARTDFRSLATPTYRGSTVLFDAQADVSDDWRQNECGYTYGLYGTPTVLELAARIAEIEQAHHTFIVPGGQAAIAMIYLAFCRSGAHALVPATAYGPNRELAAGLLKGLGIAVEPYDAMIGAGIAGLIRDNTAVIWVESPGSVTMEVQDVPAYQAIGSAYSQLGMAVSPDDCSLALRGLQTLGVRLVRFNIGLEEPSDLIDDLASSLDLMATCG